MTVLVAPDKFKGSLTARQVVEHLGQGLADRGVAYRGLPLADGGDGSVAAAIDAGFTGVEVDRRRPHRRPPPWPGRLRRPHRGRRSGGHLWLGCAAGRDPSTAAVLNAWCRARRSRRARAGCDPPSAGRRRLRQHRRRRRATRRIRRSFPRPEGLPFHPDGGRLADVAVVDTAALLDLRGVEIIVASDVRNTLSEAAAVYGPQKGATPARSTCSMRGCGTWSTASPQRASRLRLSSRRYLAPVARAVSVSPACFSAGAMSRAPSSSSTCSTSTPPSRTATWSSPARAGWIVKHAKANCPPRSPGVRRSFSHRRRWPQ